MQKATITVGATKNILDPDSMTFEERAKELEAIDEQEKKLKQKSPFTNWYQLNREHSDKMIWLAGNHPRAHQILLFLLDQMDNYNAIMCSYQVFEESLSISKQTITRSVKVLKEQGFVHIMKSGTSNVYIVNDNLAWSSWGSNRKYCKFPANVILSATENKDYLSKTEKNKIKQILIKGQDDETNGRTSDPESPTDQPNQISFESQRKTDTEQEAV